MLIVQTLVIEPKLIRKRGIVYDKNDDAKGKKIFIYTFFFLNKNQFYCVNYKQKLFKDSISRTSHSICKSKYYTFVKQFDILQLFGAAFSLLVIIEECYINGKYHKFNKNLIELKNMSSTINVFNIKT